MEIADIDADKQTLATQRQDVKEICLASAVFPEMVMRRNDASAINFAETFFRSHVLHTLHPWATRFAQAATRDLGDLDGALTGE